MTPSEYAQEYISTVLLDDPKKLTIEDLQWFPNGSALSESELAEAFAIVQSRVGEMKRMTSDDERRLMIEVMQQTEEWSFRRNRQEPDCPYRPPLLECLSIFNVRKGSAIGVALSTCSTFASNVTSKETYLYHSAALRRLLDKLGVPDGGYEMDLEEYSWWKPCDDAEIDAIVAYVKGQSRVPPVIAGDLVRYPKLWRSYARELPFVQRRATYRTRTFTPRMLAEGWTPALVLSAKMLLDICYTYGHTRRIQPHDYKRFMANKQFLIESGVWPVVEAYISTGHQENHLGTVFVIPVAPKQA